MSSVSEILFDLGQLRSYDYLRCRRGTYSHSWDDFNPPQLDRGSTLPKGERRAFVCTRCSTERHEVWSARTGELLYRRYVYPEGYHLAGSKGQFNADDLRLALIQSERPRKKR